MRLVVRERALDAEGCYAEAAPARALARRLAERPEASARLSAVRVEHDGILVFGEPDALPWIEGVVWLARAPEAPAVWLPTRCTLEPHPRLVEQAVRRRFRVEGPFALIPAPDGGIFVVPLTGARVPGGEPLETFLAVERGEP
ncbi:MAG: hypothetical protein U0234_19100 [Sandaracinus sp.]